jgi:hypothetical protein
MAQSKDRQRCLFLVNSWAQESSQGFSAKAVFKYLLKTDKMTDDSKESLPT